MERPQVVFGMCSPKGKNDQTALAPCARLQLHTLDTISRLTALESAGSYTEHGVQDSGCDDDLGRGRRGVFGGLAVDKCCMTVCRRRASQGLSQAAGAG